MSEHLRDRLKYLKHLPVSTNFEVTELEMKHLVSKETMTVFKEQLETRRRKRIRKARDEKRREKKIQHEEARMMGLNPDMVRVESDYYHKSKVQEATGGQADQFPAMSPEDDGAQEQDNTAGASFSFANVRFIVRSVLSFKISIAILDHENQASGSCPASSRSKGSRHHLDLSWLCQASSDPEECSSQG